jgi:hypothetical protein
MSVMSPAASMRFNNNQQIAQIIIDSYLHVA